MVDYNRRKILKFILENMHSIERHLGKILFGSPDVIIRLSLPHDIEWTFAQHIVHLWLRFLCTMHCKHGCVDTRRVHSEYKTRNMQYVLSIRPENGTLFCFNS